WKAQRHAGGGLIRRKIPWNERGRFRSIVRMPTRCAANCWRGRFWWIIGRRQACFFLRIFTIVKKSASLRWSRWKRFCRRELGRNMRLPRLKFKFTTDDVGGAKLGEAAGAAGPLLPGGLGE